MSIKRFKGNIKWISGNFNNYVEGEVAKVEIERAIYNEGTFKIDYKPTPEIESGLIVLKSTDNFNYFGKIKYQDDVEEVGSINLQYYENNDRALLLGLWHEDTETYTCFIELREVEQF